MEFNDIPNSQEHNTHFNKKLISHNLTLRELKVYLRFRFKNYREAGTAAGISETRVRQIIIGYKLPKTSQLINQIASGWDIDPVKLTLLFEDIPEIISADKLNSQEEKNASDNNKEGTDSKNSGTDNPNNEQRL